MNKLGNALYEIHHMDMLAAKDQWVNKIHPLVKLVLTIVFLTVTMSFPKYDLTGLLRMGIYPIVLFIVGEISLSDSIRRLRIVLPLVCFVGLFNPIFDRQVIGYIGTVPLTAGMLSMVTLMIKGIYSVLAAYLLIATTSIEKICYALRLLHIPAILVTQVLLTYRYVTVLLEEANRMTQAYSLRAPNQKGVQFIISFMRALKINPSVYFSMVRQTSYQQRIILPWPDHTVKTILHVFPNIVICITHHTKYNTYAFLYFFIR